MISLRKKDYKKVPARLKCLACKRQIKRASDAKNGDICTGNYYRDETVTDLLKAYSLHKDTLDDDDEPKCSYCESAGESMLTLQVEHFRPKGSLAQIDIAPGKTHRGYYWLGNEWSNLLLSCSRCNDKDTRFPVFNTNARKENHQPITGTNPKLRLNRSKCLYDLPYLLDEQPVLLNPEFDVPEDHLTFDTTGKIIPKKDAAGAESIRGKRTIEIICLDRNPLKIDRIKILNKFIKELRVLALGRHNGEIDDNALRFGFRNICREIIGRRKNDLPHTLWGIFVNDNIETLIAPKIPPQYQTTFRHAYRYALVNP
jgi:uncharacterized protein (TIGR02646 family)